MWNTIVSLVRDFFGSSFFCLDHKPRLKYIVKHAPYIQSFFSFVRNHHTHFTHTY